MSRRTILFLVAIGLVTAGIVTYDALPVAPVSPAADAPREMASAPPEEPTVTRALSRAALVYPGEFAHELVARLRPSLGLAEPEQAPGEMEAAVLLSARTALVAAGAPASRWRVRVDTRRIPAQLAGIDVVHGVALLRLDEDAPSTGIGLQEAPPPAPQPLVALRPQSGRPAMQYVAASSLPLRARLAAISVSAGDTVVDLEGRLAGFVGRTSRGAVALETALVRTIARHLDETGRHPHPWLGADVQTITPSLRARFPQGTLVVVYVWPGSRAAEAGLRPGQTYAAAHVSGRRVASAEELIDILEPDISVRFEPVEGSSGITVAVSDLQASPHDAADPRGLWPAADEGVPIVVVPGSEAAGAGLATGDAIEAIDLRPARLAALHQALGRGGAALLTVERENRRRFVWLPARAGSGAAPAGPGGGRR